MKRLTPARLLQLRQLYPPKTRVRLDRMEDPQAPPIGTEGTVTCVDGLATIHVQWDNGSTLGVAFGEDNCSIIAPKKL